MKTSEMIEIRLLGQVARSVELSGGTSRGWLSATSSGNLVPYRSHIHQRCQSEATCTKYCMSISGEFVGVEDVHYAVLWLCALPYTLDQPRWAHGAPPWMKLYQRGCGSTSRNLIIRCSIHGWYHNWLLQILRRNRCSDHDTLIDELSASLCYQAISGIVVLYLHRKTSSKIEPCLCLPIDQQKAGEDFTVVAETVLLHVSILGWVTCDWRWHKSFRPQITRAAL